MLNVQILLNTGHAEMRTAVDGIYTIHRLRHAVDGQ